MTTSKTPKNHTSGHKKDMTAKSGIESLAPRPDFRLNRDMSKELTELKPRIIIFGVGGAGGNAVNNMLRSSLEGVECVVANTDAQALALSLAERKIQLGPSITQGLGAGSRPEIGRAAAEEGTEEVIEQLQGCHMAFVTAGMGGGTGTGAAPVIARIAREQGVLTVAVVTKPFHFEGSHRMRIAEAGIEELEEFVDTLIVIPNQNLFRVANEKTTFADAFKMADDVLYAGVRGVTDLMTMPGLINLDFADIRTVMGEMGKAMMGAGEAEGDDRSIKAAEAAISNPLLDDVSLKGARGVLINITGGNDMTLYEVDEAANRIRDEVDPDANIIFGSTFDETMQGRVRVSIFATGITERAASEFAPTRIRVLGDHEPAASYAPDDAEPLELSEEVEEPEPVLALSDSLDDDEEIEEPREPLAAQRDIFDEPKPHIEPEPPQREFTALDPDWPSAAPAADLESERREPVIHELRTPEEPLRTTEEPLRTVEEPTHKPVHTPERDDARHGRNKTRSRLLGLLVDNDPVETVRAPAPRPAANAPSAVSAQAPRPAETVAEIRREIEPARRPEKDDSELLDIPAFLRRQAN
jgi:cell division protein FtsZ